VKPSVQIIRPSAGYLNVEDYEHCKSYAFRHTNQIGWVAVMGVIVNHQKDGALEVRPFIRNNGNDSTETATIKRVTIFGLDFYKFDGRIERNPRDLVRYVELPRNNRLLHNQDFTFSKGMALRPELEQLLFTHAVANGTTYTPINMLLRRNETEGLTGWSLHRLKL